MKYKALLVDDEKNALQSLQKLIEKHCPQLEIVDTARSVEEAYESIVEVKPDLVFLDIEMGRANAFNLLEKFQSVPFSIIFTTAFDHYAIKAIRFSALDYLLKPIDPEELLKAVEKFLLKTQDNQLLNNKLQNLLGHIKQPGNSKRIAVPDGEGLIFIDVANIIRFHSDGSYTTIYLLDGKKLMASKPIGEYDELLCEDGFFRIHRSHLINMNHIKKYLKGEGGYVLMSDGTEVEVSRRKKNEFIEAMTNR